MAKITQKLNIRTNQSLERYLQEIGEVELLKPVEEIALAKAINYKSEEDPDVQNGETPKYSIRDREKALEKLVQSNLRFVVSVAKQYQNQGLTLGDLINEGNLGLIKAAQRFDETRGFKFISYAVWWIRQSILQALAEQSRVVRLPLNRVGALNKIGKVFNVLEQSFEREPSPDEIAKELEMNATEVTDTMKMAGRHLSMDAPFAHGEDNRLLDIIRNDMQPAPDTHLMDESLKLEVRRALSTLTKREAEVIRFYFGIGREQRTLEEIGVEFSLTRERVRQIKEKAIRKLNHPTRSKALRAYLG
ncbi:MAG: sigma-70 family RNA polymerase sigma factor [Candidatus Hatepunaea meridiana]|nr:sigma-70 family RNA polymerase sigma factor [Candidatus Hatepunaea meridiana]